MDRVEGPVPNMYLRNSKAVIFVYAIDDRGSINSIKNWAVDVDRFPNINVKFLVGNKSDLEDCRDVSVERGRETAENLEIERENFFEVSAKTGKGCDELLKAVARTFMSSESNEAAKEAFPREKGDRKSRCEIN